VIFWTRVDEQLGVMQSSSGPWSRKPSPSIATHRIDGPRPGSESAVRFRGQVCRLLVEQSDEPVRHLSAVALQDPPTTRPNQPNHNESNQPPRRRSPTQAAWPDRSRGLPQAGVFPWPPPRAPQQLGEVYGLAQALRFGLRGRSGFVGGQSMGSGGLVGCATIQFSKSRS
jgi:hypothetical protein